MPPAVRRIGRTDNQVLDGLRQALSMGYDRKHKYDAVHDRLGFVSAHVVEARFGSWDRAVRLCGGTPGRAPGHGKGRGSSPIGSDRSPCMGHFWTVEVDGVVEYKEYTYPSLNELKKLGFPDPERVEIVRVDFVSIA